MPDEENLDVEGAIEEYGRAELDDARMLVEKVVALGGDPATEVAELRWTGKPDDAVGWLIETEEEAIETCRRRSSRPDARAARRRSSTPWST